MEKMRNKGFTLIELLAVIVIMGILVMIAIPAMTRYIENSRKDAFVNSANTYADLVSKMWFSDSLRCGGTNATSLDAGTYYVEIGLSEGQPSTGTFQRGGKSPWNNAYVKGYIKVVVENISSTNTRLSTKFYINLADTKGHGINDETKEVSSLVRGDVKTAGAVQKTIPAGLINCSEV